jgi:uncharacterized protein YeaO (DUF488 family)
MTPTIHIKRIYEEPSPKDGFRVLVDRLWPRGVSKDAAQLDDWWKELAPSTDLRKWFHHEEQKWEEFTDAYQEELQENHEQLLACAKQVQDEDLITLLYAAKDTEHNHARVLKSALSSALAELTGPD